MLGRCQNESRVRSFGCELCLLTTVLGSVQTVLSLAPSSPVKDWAFPRCPSHTYSWYFHLLPKNLFTCEMSKQSFLAPVPTCLKHVAAIRLQKSMKLVKHLINYRCTVSTEYLKQMNIINKSSQKVLFFHTVIPTLLESALCCETLTVFKLFQLLYLTSLMRQSHELCQAGHNKTAALCIRESTLCLDSSAGSLSSSLSRVRIKRPQSQNKYPTRAVTFIILIQLAFKKSTNLFCVHRIRTVLAKHNRNQNTLFQFFSKEGRPLLLCRSKREFVPRYSKTDSLFVTFQTTCRSPPATAPDLLLLQSFMTSGCRSGRVTGLSCSDLQLAVVC